MDSNTLLYAQGSSLQFEEKLVEALSFYEAMIARDPHDWQAQREKAFCLLRLDQISDASDALESMKQAQQSHSITRDFKSVFIEIKVIIRSEDDSTNALKKTRALHRFAYLLEDKIRVIGTSDAWYLLVIGILSHLMLNKLKMSIELLEASYAIMPAIEKALVALEVGNFYHELYLIEEETELQQQLAISKSDCLAAAIAWFQKVTTYNPHEGRGYLILSQIYLNQGEFDQSAAQSELALQLNVQQFKPIALLQQATLQLRRNNDLNLGLKLMEEAYAATQKQNQSQIISKSSSSSSSSDDSPEKTEEVKADEKKSESESLVGLVLYQARNLSERGFISEAVEILEKNLKEFPKNAEIYMELGHTYFLTGSVDDIPKSIDFYLKCYEVDEQFKDPAAAIGLGAYYLEKVSEIQEIQDSGEDAQTRDFDAEIVDACKKALEQFNKALQMDAKRCRKVHKSIATCYRLLQKFPQAVASYEKELEEDADDLDTLIEFASLLRELGNKKKGVAIIERILLLDQNNDDIYVMLCEMLSENFDKIVSVLKRVFERGDNLLDNIAQLIARTLVRYDKRQLFKQPEKWLSVAFQINSSNPETLFTQGLLYLEKDEFQNALGWMAKCLQADPDHEECIETMLEVIQEHFEELKQEDIKEALQVMKATDEEWLQERLAQNGNEMILALVEFGTDPGEEDQNSVSGEEKQEQSDIADAEGSKGEEQAV